MIDGKAILKFGKGSIRVTPLCNNLETSEPIGAVCFNRCEPGEINRRIPTVDQTFSKEASVIMTFSKPESIDVVINALLWVKQIMNNETPETDRIGWDEPFDLDILKEKEEMKKKELLPEVKRYAKVILAAPEGTKRVEIHSFKTKEEAEAKSERLKSWPYKVIVRARSEKGKFAKGFALICCK